jgi:hypothetical protein
MRSVPAVARFGERVGSEHRPALRGNHLLDRRADIGIVDVAVVDHLVITIAEKTELLEACRASHALQPTWVDTVHC